jgi:hypothetical protein
LASSFPLERENNEIGPRLFQEQGHVAYRCNERWEEKIWHLETDSFMEQQAGKISTFDTPPRVVMLKNNLLFSLPNDLIRLIFKYLTLKELGNFDKAILSHSLRSQFIETLKGHEILFLEKIACSSILLRWLGFRSILITSITIAEYYSNQCLPLISRNASSLRAITILATYCSDEIEQSLFSSLARCPHLQSISFKMINGEAIQTLFLTNGTQRVIPNLKTIKLNHCYFPTNQTVLLIASSCPSLQHLNLSNCAHVSDLEIEVIIQRCPHLLSLELTATAITDLSVHQILGAYLPGLEILTLTNCLGVSLAAKAAALRLISLPQIQSNLPDVQLLGSRSIRKAVSG